MIACTRGCSKDKSNSYKQASNYDDARPGVCPGATLYGSNFKGAGVEDAEDASGYPLEPNSNPVAQDVVQLTGTNLKSLLPLQGTHWLGMGYDIFVGNPDGDDSGSGMGVDPGIRRPCVQVTTHLQDPDYRTADNRNVQPVEGYAYEWDVCSMASKYEEQTTTDQYSSSLAADASVTAGYGALAFEASAGYQNFKNNMGSAFGSKFRSVSYCLKGEVGFHTQHVHQPTPDFEAACKVLSKFEINSGGAKQAWYDFFELWGTHFMGMVRLGGKMVHTLEMSESDSTEESSTSMNASVALKYDGIMAQGGVSASVEREQDAKKYLAENTKDEKLVVVGGLPAPTDTDSSTAFAAWAATVEAHPMPVQYKLLPLCYIGWSDLTRATGDQAKNYLLNPNHYAKMLEDWSKDAVEAAKKRWDAERILQGGSDTLVSDADNSYLEGSLAIVSKNKKYYLEVAQGHLVLNKLTGVTPTEVWSTKTWADLKGRKTNGKCTLAVLDEEVGELVIKETTESGNAIERYRLGYPVGPNSYLRLTNDGSLKCFDKQHNLFWRIPGPPNKPQIFVTNKYLYSTHSRHQCYGQVSTDPTDKSTAFAACSQDELCSCVSCNGANECSWYKKRPETTVHVGTSLDKFKEVPVTDIQSCAPTVTDKDDKKYEVSMPSPGTVRVTGEDPSGWETDLKIKCLAKYGPDIVPDSKKTAYVRGVDRKKPCKVKNLSFPNVSFTSQAYSSNSYKPIGAAGKKLWTADGLNSLKKRSVCDSTNKVDSWTPLYNFWRNHESEYKIYVKEDDGGDNTYHYGCKLGFSDKHAETTEKNPGWTPESGHDVKQGVDAFRMQMEACQTAWIDQVKKKGKGRDGEGEIDIKYRKFDVGMPRCTKGECTGGDVTGKGKPKKWLEAKNGIKK